MNGVPPFDPGDRFLRPTADARTRRNGRTVQVQRVLVVAANLLLVTAVVLGAVWMFQRARGDQQFRVRAVETTGNVHTPRAALDAVTQRYIGMNLFRIEIGQVNRDLSRLPWIRSVSIEKKLPATLAIRIVERKPSALVLAAGQLRYVDREGVVYAPLSAAVGNPELPIITAADAAGIRKCLGFLAILSSRAPALYSRVSEIATEGDDSFAVFDRGLATRVLLREADAWQKWNSLYEIVNAVPYERGSLEYADLRFRKRLVLKPRKGHAVRMAGQSSAVAGEITN